MIRGNSVLSSLPTFIPDEIESLLQEVMKKMAKEFPGEDIVLNAYESTQPLRKLGRAQLDGKTEEITYLGAR